MHLIGKILFAFLLSCGLVSQVNAYSLEEQVLETPNKKCKIYYLTEKNTHAWHIETDREECESDKLLRGYHNITVYNAFSKPIEKLYGYFSAGYWTGNSLLPEIELKRFSDELGVQKATFPVYNDLDNNIFYIGQMSSQKNAAGTYPPFKVCTPFRMLGIISDTSRLNNPHFLQKVFQTVEKQTRRFCPTESAVQLYLSDTNNPAPEDVYMYVQLDLKSHHHKIMRSPKASRQSLKSHRTTEDTDWDEKELYQKLLPILKKAKRKSALFRAFTPDSEEMSLVDFLSEPIENKTKLSPTESHAVDENQLSKENVSDVSDEFTADLKISPQNEKEAEKIPVTENKTSEEQSAAAYFDTTIPARPQENETDSEKTEIPAPQKSYLMPLQPMKKKKHIIKNGLLDISDERQSPANVLLLLHTLNVPVKAQTVLQIQNNKAAVLKETVFIKGNHENGHYLVRGIFSLKSNNGKNTGVFVQPSKITLCYTNNCIDEEANENE